MGEDKQNEQGNKDPEGKFNSFRYIVNYLKNREMIHLELYVIGLLIMALGLFLCFTGVRTIPYFLWILCTLAIGTLILIFFLNIFSQKVDEPLGICFIVLSLAITVPISYKASIILQEYGIPLVCGLAA